MASKKTNKDNSKIQLWIAVVGGLVTIIVALFNFPPFQRLFEPVLSPTVVPTVASISTLTSTVTVTFTETPSLPLPTETFTPVPALATDTATLIPTASLPTGMQVKFSASLSTGRAPLKVKFDARDSFFIDTAGNIFPCGACTYSWQVREGSTNLYGPEKGNGNFEFTFGKRGTFYVSVYVCRSGSLTDCGGSGTQIIVN